MKHLRNSIYLLLVLALVAAPLTFSPRPASAQVTFTCLPSCEENDGRFLSVAGTGMSTVADQPIILTFGSPATAASLEISIFDGETGGQWDYATTDMHYELFADPVLAGDTSVRVADAFGSTMPDNAWFTFNVPNVPAAQSPSGNYFYRLEVHPEVLGTSYWSNFKVRSDGVGMLVARPFSYVASARTDADRHIIYPNYPDLSQTTYDGHFDFHIYMPVSRDSFWAWDGDFDFGSFDLAFNDTDDPNTPNDVLPPWAVPAETNLEGVAISPNGTTGNPSDDSSAPIFRRSPSLVYDVVLPDGRIITNSNPSGNIEWEKFLFSTDAAATPDVVLTSRIPSGLYQIHANGVDMSNLNAWKFPYLVLPVCPLVPPDVSPDPCKTPLFPFLIGDTVFRDPNGNGVQEAGEEGIPGVVVHLLDSSGSPVNDGSGTPITAVTDANGMYSFNVPGRTVDPYTNEVILDGVYSVRVGDENFTTGNPLAGMSSTTGGELLTRTVIDSNVLTYDFGYRVPSNVCVYTPGYWKTHADAWPVTSITIAGVTYTREEAIRLMSRAPKFDMTYQLFTQLVAAKLNILLGNESQCIDADIEIAETWLLTHPLGSGVILGSQAWIDIMYTFKHLDSYNKGKLCADPCTWVITPPTPLPPKPPKFLR